MMIIFSRLGLNRVTFEHLNGRSCRGSNMLDFAAQLIVLTYETLLRYLFGRWLVVPLQMFIEAQLLSHIVPAARICVNLSDVKLARLYCLARAILPCVCAVPQK